MATFDWDDFDLSALACALRDSGSRPEAEKMIWAFEQALPVARLDPELLDYLLAAVVCLVARSTERTPRDVLETFFRRSVDDREWRTRYRPLFA